jgi:hypothetical protein
MHAPLAHTWPAPQTAPQPPQFMRSVRVSAQ